MADDPGISDEQWQKAKVHFDKIMSIYQEMLGQPGIATGPALMIVFEPLLRRYNNGERSRRLYDEMMEVA